MDGNVRRVNMRSVVSVMWRGALVAVAACVVSIMGAPAVFALCAETSEEQHFDQATIVFEGVAQPGDSVDGTLLSPATFEVERYLKGDGPPELQVTTAVSDAGGGLYAELSTGIHPSAGERWRIFATGPADEVLATSACHGSRLIAAADDDPGVAESNDPSPFIPLRLTLIAAAVAVSLALVRR